MTKLREQMIQEMTLRGLSANTQRTYLRAVSQLAQHYGRSPAQISNRDIKAYLFHLHQNEMQRALAMAEAGKQITAKMLSPVLSGELPAVRAQVLREDSLRNNMQRVEAWMIRQSLEQHGGRRAATARKLGITREGLLQVDEAIEYRMRERMSASS